MTHADDNTPLTAANAHRLSHQMLVALCPRLRPFGTEERSLVLEALRRELNRQHRVRSNDTTADWRETLDSITSASAQRPGSLTITRTRCPGCGGRRFDAHRGIVCPHCHGSGQHRRDERVMVLSAQQLFS